MPCWQVVIRPGWGRPRTTTVRPDISVDLSPPSRLYNCSPERMTTQPASTPSSGTPVMVISAAVFLPPPGSGGGETRPLGGRSGESPGLLLDTGLPSGWAVVPSPTAPPQ